MLSKSTKKTKKVCENLFTRRGECDIIRFGNVGFSECGYKALQNAGYDHPPLSELLDAKFIIFMR